jgi:hypothetical protein
MSLGKVDMALMDGWTPIYTDYLAELDGIMRSLEIQV